MIITDAMHAVPTACRPGSAFIDTPRCLVVTVDRRLRDSIRIAAAIRTDFVCVTAATVTEIDRLAADEQEIVFIDMVGLVGAVRRRALRLAAARARCHATLVVVCGHEEDAADEHLAQRLGVGLFLPGVSIVTAVNCVLDEFTRPGRPVANCPEA